MTTLFASTDLKQWTSWNQQYESIFQAFAHSEKKSKKTLQLIELEEWYSNQLPEIIKSKKYLSKQDVVRLLEWKLTKGTFRPSLKKLVESNSNDLVEEATRKAFLLYPNLKEALKELTRLRGIGPAAASGILSAAYDAVPYMSDEVMIACGLGKLSYTIPFYLKFEELIRKKVQELNDMKDQRHEDRKSWTAKDVGRALWSFHYRELLSSK